MATVRVDAFATVDGTLHAEGVALSDIAAAVGTPCYVYSANTIRELAQRLSAKVGRTTKDEKGRA